MRKSNNRSGTGWNELAALCCAAIFVLLTTLVKHTWESCAFTFGGLILTGFAWRFSRGLSFSLQAAAIFLTLGVWMVLIIKGLITELHFISVALFISSIVFLESREQRSSRQKGAARL